MYKDLNVVEISNTRGLKLKTIIKKKLSLEKKLVKYLLFFTSVLK